MGALDCVSANERMKSGSTEVFTVNMASSTSLDEPRRDLESQFSKSNTNTRSNIWWTLSTDVPLIILVIILVTLYELGVFPQFKAGFYCNDPALSFKFTGDTVTAVGLMVPVLLAPLIVIFASELIFLDSNYLQRPRTYQALRNSLWLYRSYAYGLFFNLGLVEVMKAITGSPRPTFFDICEPDTAKTCNGSEFVTTFQCTSTRFSVWFQFDSYHSFPSGHTSLSIYAAFFTAWYLQRRAFDWTYRSVFLVPVLQLVCLSYAAICSLTRITDHRHHWWDVLTGSFIGAISLFYAVLVLCDNFSYANSKMTPDISEDNLNSRTLLFDTRRRDLVT